jgi:hypothetical protein
MAALLPLEVMRERVRYLIKIQTIYPDSYVDMEVRDLKRAREIVAAREKDGLRAWIVKETRTREVVE